MNDHLICMPLDRDTVAMAADPRLAHQVMARYLPDLHGRTHSIRADTGTLFRIDLPSDPLGQPGEVVLRLRGPALTHLPDTVTHVPVPALTDGLRVVAMVAAQKRLTTPHGVRVRPVTDPEASRWATDLFARNGLHITDLAVSGLRRYGSGQSARFAVRDLAATLTVTDPHLALAALRDGIGRGRAFGLGMLVPIPHP